MIQVLTPAMPRASALASEKRMRHAIAIGAAAIQLCGALLWFASAATGMSTPIAEAQIGGQAIPLSPPQSSGIGGDMPGQNRPGQNSPPLEISQKQLEAWNRERQKQVVAETAKLLALTKDFEAAVGKPDTDPADPALRRKAEQIEKLAKAIREKMTRAIGPVSPMPYRY